MAVPVATSAQFDADDGLALGSSGMLPDSEIGSGAASCPVRGNHFAGFSTTAVGVGLFCWRYEDR